MAKFRKQPVVIEAFTFDEFVKAGVDSGAPLTHEMPWSFEFKGHKVTHENDTCYLIPTLEGTMKFTPGDMLIVGVKGEIYPCKLDIFEATYEREWEPHQRRVIEEKGDLDEKIVKLSDFLVPDHPISSKLDRAERDRLWEQLAHMRRYSHVLGTRILAF